MSSGYDEKTDYYELLGVTEEFKPNELKKAYYKAAMKWHPDRNPNNVEEATRVFQLIEHAYSVLSDVHERAWYDDHRNFNVDEQGQMVATKVDIYGLFNAGAFRGFDDTARGFYTVFRDAFETLAKEEKTTAPSFGTSTSSWEDVEAFYAYWSCFKTTRSFAFNDLYQLRDAPNAWYRREMSKENQKVRQKAEKEFVAAVRELCAFARKRDPRVTAHVKLLEEQKEQRRMEEERKKEEKRRQVMEELERLEQEHKKQKRVISEDALLYLNEFDDANGNEDPDWHCDYCGRVMDNESAYRQHCSTKKHKKNAASARRDFMSDPTIFEHSAYMFMMLGLSDAEAAMIDPDVDMNVVVSPNSLKKKKRTGGKRDRKRWEEEEEGYEPPPKKGKNKNKNKKGQKEEPVEEEEDEDDTPQNRNQKGKNKNQKGKNQPQKGKNQKGKNKNMDNDDDEEEEDEDEIQKKRAAAQPLSKKEKRKLKMQKQAEKKAAKEAQAAKMAPQEGQRLTKRERKLLQQQEALRAAKFGEYDDEYEEEEDEEKPPKQEEVEAEPPKAEGDEQPTEEQPIEEPPAEEEKPPQEEENQGGRGKNKKEKNKKQLKTQPIQKAPKKGAIPPGMFMCKTCRGLFPSKTKLFAHLKESGHAVYK